MHDKKRIVLAVIGAHGSGKTTLLEVLRDSYGIPFFSSSREAYTGFLQHFNDHHAHHFGFHLVPDDAVAGPGEVVFDYRMKDRIRHLMDEYAMAERKNAENPAIFTQRATEKALKVENRVIAITDMLHPAEMQFLTNLEDATTYFIEVTAEKRIGTEQERGNYGPLQRVRDVWIEYHRPRLEKEGRYITIENNGTREEFNQRIKEMAERIPSFS